jgi:hypothetical protein
VKHRLASSLKSIYLYRSIICKPLIRSYLNSGCSVT